MEIITKPPAGTSETELSVPAFLSGISAGFPSPADDFAEGGIDLNRELIRHPQATFFGRVTGDSMHDMGIGHGDLLVIDKSLRPCSGQIAVCFLDGEFTVKLLEITREKVRLVPANRHYPIREVNRESDFRIWGIVTYVIKSFRHVCAD